MRSAPVFLLAPLLLIACGARPSERTETRASAINGGAADTSTSSVVAVFARLPTGDEMCTGFLIAPDLVLTARHCAAPVDNPKAPCVSSDGGAFTIGGAPLAAKDVYISPDAVITETSKTIRVTDVLVAPGSIGAALCGADVALLRLAITLSGVTPLPVRVDTAPFAGETFTGVGYGVADPVKDDSGTRRILEGLSVASVGAGARTVDGEWIADRGPCAGDSGGPAIASDGAVIGVMSRGSKATCASMIYERVDVHATWLREQARASAERRGVEPPDWVTGKTPDAGVEAPEAAPPPTAPPQAPASVAQSGCAVSPPRLRDESHVAALLALAGVCARLRRRRVTASAFGRSSFRWCGSRATDPRC